MFKSFLRLVHSTDIGNILSAHKNNSINRGCLETIKNEILKHAASSHIYFIILLTVLSANVKQGVRNLYL